MPDVNSLFDESHTRFKIRVFSPSPRNTKRQTNKRLLYRSEYDPLIGSRPRETSAYWSNVGRR